MHGEFPENRSEARKVFEMSGGITLSNMWSFRRGDPSGDSYTAQDMLDVLDRRGGDPERQEMLDWVPGSEDELRERLRR